MHGRFIALAAVGLLLGGLACAQYQTGFEAPTFATVPGGQVLSGQDTYFLPVQGGADYMVFAYSDPAGPMQVANPRGSAQYASGLSAGNNARAERAISWGNTGKWTVWYDLAAGYDVNQAWGNNIASFSPRPDVNPAGPDTRNTYIHLFSFVPDANQPNGLDPNHYRGLYATWINGGQNYGPSGAGLSPGPEWEALVFNHWYRYRSTMDFALNTFTKLSLIDLHTGTGTTADVTLDPNNYPGNWYLEGEGSGSAGPPQGFRMFTGTPTGNAAAWDNVCIAPGVGPGDLNCDGAINFDDINPFVLALSNPAGYQAAFPNCCLQNGDCNLDGQVSFDDINPFVALLTGH